MSACYTILVIFLIGVLLVVLLSNNYKKVSLEGGQRPIPHFAGPLTPYVQGSLNPTGNIYQLIPIRVAGRMEPRHAIKNREHRDSRGRLQWLPRPDHFLLDRYRGPPGGLNGTGHVPFYEGTCNGICHAVQNKGHGPISHSYQITTAWASVSGGAKAGTPGITPQGKAPPCDYMRSRDLYFLIVPNTHTTTQVNIPNTALNYIYSHTAAGTLDPTWTTGLMAYTQAMVRDAISFANYHIFNRVAKRWRRGDPPLLAVNYMYPTFNGGRNYQLRPPRSGRSNLYMAFHESNNSENHLHLHCWLNGEDDAFGRVIAYQAAQFVGFNSQKLIYDLGLTSPGDTETLPVECFFKKAGSGNPTQPPQHFDF